MGSDAWMLNNTAKNKKNQAADNEDDPQLRDEIAHQQLMDHRPKPAGGNTGKA